MDPIDSKLASLHLNSSTSEEKAKTSVDDEDDTYDYDEVEEEILDKFAEARKRIHIVILVEKLRVLHPLISDALNGSSLLNHYLSFMPAHRHIASIFSQEFKTYISDKMFLKKINDTQVHSVIDKFLVAWRHILSSHGYSMLHFLKSYPDLACALYQHIDELAPVQEGYLAFCQHYHSPSKEKRSYLPENEMFLKKRRMDKESFLPDRSGLRTSR